MFLVLSDHNNVIERSSDISRSTFSSVCVLYALVSWSLTCNLHLVVRFNESSGSNLSKIGLLSDFFVILAVRETLVAADVHWNLPWAVL